MNITAERYAELLSLGYTTRSLAGQLAGQRCNRLSSQTTPYCNTDHTILYTRQICYGHNEYTVHSAPPELTPAEIAALLDSGPPPFGWSGDRHRLSIWTD